MSSAQGPSSSVSPAAGAAGPLVSNLLNFDQMWRNTTELELWKQVSVNMLLALGLGCPATNLEGRNKNKNLFLLRIYAPLLFFIINFLGNQMFLERH